MQRLAIALVLVTLIASSASAAVPNWYAVVLRTCEEGVSQLELRMSADEDVPVELPVSVTVTRKTVLPGFEDPVLLTAEPVPMVDYGGYETVVLTEPQFSDDRIGIYEIRTQWANGEEHLEGEYEHSCSAHPYLMRGRLITNNEFEPCEGIGLLECPTVSIADLEFLQYVGTGQMVDIYGWPIWLAGVDQCGISITNVEPLPEGEGCEGVVATQPMSWGAVKGLYR